MSVPAFSERRGYGAMRTALICYGTAAYTYFFLRPGPVGETQAFGTGGSASSLVLIGLGVQVLLMLAGVVVKRLVGDRSVAGQAYVILDLIGDGVTVLLFALATFGTIAHFPEEL